MVSDKPITRLSTRLNFRMARPRAAARKISWLGDLQIVERYPSLNLAQVYGAISYYYENRQELEADLAEDDNAEAEHERREAEYLSHRAQ